MRLEVLDYGGHGSPVILLHGLAGTANEWAATAACLTGAHRVLAPDRRGHGRSERRPDSVSPVDAVADVLAIIEELGLGRVSLVGQSLGGQTAFLVAARHPEAIRALVVAEASPEPTTTAVVHDVRSWLESWPVPFESREAARRFFGGTSVAAQAWASGLEKRADGWWPSFDLDVVVETLCAVVGDDYWEEWERIAVPTLVTRGEGGSLSREEAAEMVARALKAEVTELPGAGHDVHLDASEDWCRVVGRFLASVEGE